MPRSRAARTLVGKVCDRPLSRASPYKLLKAGKVQAVKSDSATIIVTSPAEYLASLRDEVA